MATSPIYSWPEPDNTDLVKNGALAIRTMGNAIDTTMATMTPKSIVDAKGDIIAATANDTPARLAVGSDFGFLQATSSAATGLAWNSGAWTAYTPTVSPASGSFTTVSSAGRYQRIGKTCILEFTVNITTNGTAAGATYVTLPFTASGGSPTPYWTGTCKDFFVTGQAGFTTIGGGGTFLVFQSYLGTYLGGSGYYIGGSIEYEVA